MDNLPQELLDEIQAYLSFTDALSLRAVSRRMRASLCDLELTYSTIRVIIHPISLQKLYDLTKHRRLANQVKTLIVGTEALDQFVSQNLKGKVIQERLRQLYKGGSIGKGEKPEADLEELRQSEAGLLVYCIKRLANLKILCWEDAPQTYHLTFEGVTANEEAPRRFAGSQELSRLIDFDIHWNGPYPVLQASFEKYLTKSISSYYNYDVSSAIGENLPRAGRAHSWGVACNVIKDIRAAMPSLKIYVTIRARTICNSQTLESCPFFHMPKTWDANIIWKNATSMTVEHYQFEKWRNSPKKFCNPLKGLVRSTVVNLHLSRFCRGRFQAQSGTLVWGEDAFDYSRINVRNFPYLRSLSLTDSYTPCQSRSFQDMMSDLGSVLHNVSLDNLWVCQVHGSWIIWDPIERMTKLKKLSLGKMLVWRFDDTLDLPVGGDEVRSNVDIREYEHDTNEGVKKGVLLKRENTTLLFLKDAAINEVFPSYVRVVRAKSL